VPWLSVPSLVKFSKCVISIGSVARACIGSGSGEDWPRRPSCAVGVFQVLVASRARLGTRRTLGLVVARAYWHRHQAQTGQGVSSCNFSQVLDIGRALALASGAHWPWRRARIGLAWDTHWPWRRAWVVGSFKVLDIGRTLATASDAHWPCVRRTLALASDTHWCLGALKSKISGVFCTKSLRKCPSL
jgi:hypothetical protein